MKPLIGVTVSRRSGWRIFPLMALNVWLAGGKAVKWVTLDEADLDKVDGVIIGGGDDISPELYGGQMRLEARIDPARDRFEQTVLRRAFRANMPIFGICRGAQMLNVVLGGTLDQDAYATYGSRFYKTILPRKTVRIEPDTRLERLCGGAPMKVNALHTQAVKDLGEGLAVAAKDDGGMVQAIERIKDPFALGTQWHPEHLFFARRQRRLFQGLIAAARAYQAGRSQTRTVSEDFGSLAGDH